MIKIKEQDYIDIQDKARIRAVINILQDIVPSISTIIEKKICGNYETIICLGRRIFPKNKST